MHGNYYFVLSVNGVKEETGLFAYILYEKRFLCVSQKQSRNELYTLIHACYRLFNTFFSQVFFLK